MTTEPEAIPADVLVSIPRDLAERVTEIANRKEQSIEGDKLAVLLSAPGASRAPVDGAKPVATHRHKKRGSEYVLIGFGKMQADNWHDHGSSLLAVAAAPVDMREVAIYRSVDDGSLWVRPREEFEDGRFEPLPALTSPEAPQASEVVRELARQAGDLVTTAIRRMRAAHVDCRDLTMDCEQLLRALAAYKRSTTDGQ